MQSMARGILTNNHLKAIGLVAAEWAYVELYLEGFIWEIANIDDRRGHAITTHIPSETRINILETLADTRLINPAHKRELKVIVDRIRKLRTARNNIVHSLWLSTKTTSINQILSDYLAKKKRRKPIPASVRISAKGKLNVTNTPMKSKQIMAAASEIGELFSDMNELLSRISADRRVKEIAPAKS